MILDSFCVFHVSSVSRAYDFYVQDLGFRLAFGAPPDGRLRDPYYLGLARDAAVLHLSSHAGDGVPGGIAYFLVDDIDSLHSEFVKRRVPIHLAPTDQTWGMREMYVRDPDGNTIRFGSRTGR